MRSYLAGLLALIAGSAMAGPQDGGIAVHLSDLQQTPVGDSAVSVPATTSTLIWTADTTVRFLRIVPSNSSCTMQCDPAAAATGNSTPIPGGYVFNLVERPPIFSCYAYCTSATNVAVSPGR